MAIDDVSGAYELAQRVVVEAGRLAAGIQGADALSYGLNETDSVSDLGNITTAADRRAHQHILEELIRQGLHDNAQLTIEQPQHHESLFAQFSESGQYRWVIDPLDGSLMFSSGTVLRAPLASLVRQLGEDPDTYLRQDAWGPMMCLMERDELLFSVIYLPISDQLYTAYTGQGAAVSACGETQAVLKTTDERFSFDHEINANSEMYDMFRRRDSDLNVRHHSSYAFTASQIASGRPVSILARNVEAYDLLPPMLLVREAGGAVLDEAGNDASENSRHVIFGPNKEYVETMLNELGRRRYLEG